MGYLGNDLWVVDILPAWLDSNLVVSPIDSTRYLEFEIEADDPPAATSRPISPVTTLEIVPTAACRPERARWTGRDVCAAAGGRRRS